MSIIFMKKNPLKTVLILLVLLCSVSCIYALKNYRPTETSQPQNRTFQSQSQNRKPPIQNQQRQGRPQNGKNMGSRASDSKYSPVLTVYLTIFIGISLLFLYFIKYKKLTIGSDNRKILIFSLLFIGLLLRIILSTVVEGYSGDINLFKNWASTAANNFLQFYSNSRSSDYPPLYIYVLYIVGKICSINSINPYYTLLLKLPSMIADMFTAYLIYKLAKKNISFEAGIFLSAFYIFNPAVFIDSTLWGQVDSFFSLFIVSSVFLICRGRIIFSSVLFTCSVLMKPQGIIFLPVLFFELVRRRDMALFIKSVISALVTAVIIILPFSYNQDVLWIFKLYSKTISEYPYASVNGFNFFNLFGGNYKQSSIIFFIFSYKIWGMIAIIAVTLFSWFVYMASGNKIFAFITALIQISGVFTFSTGMHERYLFPALALSILCYIYIKDKRFFTLCIGYSITIYANIYSVLFGNSGGMNMISDSHSMLSDGISLLNIILFIYLIKISIDIVKSNVLKDNNILYGKD